MQAQQLQQEEMERHIQTRHKKMVAAEAKLIAKQQNEMSALK